MRLDLVADVGVLQSGVTRATVQDLHLANSVVKKAKMSQYDEIGIVYRHLPTSSPWRLAAEHDAIVQHPRTRSTARRESSSC